MIFEKGEWEGKELTQYWIETNSYNNLKSIWQVSAICFNDEGEILLVKHPKKDYWSIPGGKPKNTETPEETLIREVFEESTCEIKDLKLLGAIKVDFPDNPCKIQGKNYYQLRYFARIKKINKHTNDPDLKLKRERIFVKPEEYFNYINYGKLIGTEIIKLAINNLK